jgi:DNA polymerase III delta prime subunit
MKIDNPDWTEKYRPKTINDVILPERLKNIFRQFVLDKNIPNLILSGKSGIGKTTIAKALMCELGVDYIVINGSLDGNIETLRTKISEFASSVSFAGGRKMIIIDEGDFLTQATQPALRNFVESYSGNCGFIITCNYPKKILSELRSRFSNIDFNIKKSEKNRILVGYLKKICEILDTENVKYEKSILADLITRFFPDFRRVIHECQTYAKTGDLNTGILGIKIDENFEDLLENIKNKNYTATRKWVAENYDIDSILVMRKLYDELEERVIASSVAEMDIILAEYQFKHAFAVDPEINLSACLAEIMSTLVWR